MSSAYPSEIAYWEELDNFNRGLWALCWLIAGVFKIITVPLWGSVWLLGWATNKLGIRL